MAHLKVPKRPLSRETPLESFGWPWRRVVWKATGILDSLHPGGTLSMQFETLLKSPKKEMTRFIEFVGPESGNER